MSEDLENTLILNLETGKVVIRMRPDLAPGHVARIKELVREGFYDDVVFHRVIPGFMAQGGDPTGTGRSGSSKPNLKAEFSKARHVRGICSMARTPHPDSANSQFFIIRQTSSSIDQRYTAFGRVLQGLEFVRLIKVGEPVTPPQDKMTRVRLGSDLPPGETVAISRLDVKSPNFTATSAVTKDRKGPDFTVCDVDIPVKDLAAK